MTSWSELPLTEEHATYLREQAAITAEVAASHGLRSATTVDELPEWAQSWGEKAVPAIVFPWKTIYDEVIEQVRPDTEIEHNGETYKYLFPKGAGAVLNALRHDKDAERVLIVEGTKQGLAAASWAPDGVAVYGVGGCRNWSSDGIPDADLEVCDGKEVYILLDADVASNRDVYDAAVKLSQAAQMEQAADVRFCRLVAGGTKGLDDVLSTKREDRRAGAIEALMKKAHPSKPAQKMPAPKPKPRGVMASPSVAASSGGTDRPIVLVDQDRKLVIDNLTHHLIDRWDGHRLFNHGEAISELTRGKRMGQEVQAMAPVPKGKFLDLIQDTVGTAKPVMDNDGNQIGISWTWPDGQSIDAVMSRYERFTQLDRIVRAPFVRPDGTICQVNGYDETTRTLVAMDAGMQSISVPDEPTASQVRAAVDRVRKGWLRDLLGDMPTDADRANAIAMILTPFVRGMVRTAPLAVIDGLQMGVGKNYLADMMAITSTGRTIDPMPWSMDDQENRKVITATFRQGGDIFVFDEAHHLHGASLARALTSETWSDRQLGINQMLEFPNKVTWVSLGNGVRVEGDIVRRVYRIAIRPKGKNPQDRTADDFLHADLRQWTIDNRPQLVEALLTIVRSWFAAGQPRAPKAVSFGSFESWERVLGGILAHAGIDGFLGNMSEWRSQSSFSLTYWTRHVEWLHRTFGDGQAFTVAQVREALMRDPHSETPPGMTDLAGSDSRAYNRQLGQEYAGNVDRWYGDVQLVSLGKAHGNVNTYAVVTRDQDGESDTDTSDPTSADPEGGNGGNGGNATTHAMTEKNNYFPQETRSEKNSFCDVEPGAGEVTPVTPAPSLVAPEHGPAAGLTEQSSLLPDPVPQIPAQRPDPEPTPPVYGGDTRPADWAPLFAVDAPDLEPTLCECGTDKVPDAEMAYFLLCPTCTPGSLRPADAEV